MRAWGAGGKSHATLGGCHARMGGWRAKLCDPGASPQLCAGSVCRSVGSVAGCTGHHLGSASGTLQLVPIRVRVRFPESKWCAYD